MFLLSALVGHCGGIARLSYGTGLPLFFISACGMAHGFGGCVGLKKMFLNSFIFLNDFFHYKHTKSHRHHRPRAPLPRHPHPAPSTADRRPPTADRRPPTAERRPPSADRRAPTAQRSAAQRSAAQRSASSCRVARVPFARHRRVTRASRTHARTPLTTDH